MKKAKISDWRHNTMRIALSMWSLHKYYKEGNMNVLDFINYAGALEIEGVELLDCFWKNTENELPEVLQSLENTGLQVACYSVGNNFVQPDPVKRNTQIEIVKTGVDIAYKLGAKVVRVFSGDLGAEDVPFDTAKKWIVESLKECADYAESNGVTLGLENHGLFAGKSSQVNSILSEVGSDNLRSTFDTGNFLLVDESPSEAIEKLASLVAHVHFKDFRKADVDSKEIYTSISGQDYTGTVAGEGEVDLVSILTTLKSTDYTGWLSVEFEGEEDQKYGSAKSIENLRETLKRI
jgi:sugar phosphate isomerase/epimerase